MIKPEVFDIVELIVNLPEHNQFIGSQVAIVECYDDHHFEIEFSNEDGETTALCRAIDNLSLFGNLRQSNGLPPPKKLFHSWIAYQKINNKKFLAMPVPFITKFNFFVNSPPELRGVGGINSY